jgi:hypothetical protein
LAIQTALLHAPLNFDIQIYSDSTSAISSQQKIQQVGQTQLTTREIMKIPNNLVYQINKHLILERQASVTYNHVKAHTNSKDVHSWYNGKADTLAADPGIKEYDKNLKPIRKLYEEIYFKQYTLYIPQEIATSHIYTQTFSNGILNLQYPRKQIKKQFYTQQDKTLFNKLKT